VPQGKMSGLIRIHFRGFLYSFGGPAGISNLLGHGHAKRGPDRPVKTAKWTGEMADANIQRSWRIFFVAFVIFVDESFGFGL
jgi:hypothetical protein